MCCQDVHNICRTPELFLHFDMNCCSAVQNNSKQKWIHLRSTGLQRNCCPIRAATAPQGCLWLLSVIDNSMFRAVKRFISANLAQPGYKDKKKDRMGIANVCGPLWYSGGFKITSPDFMHGSFCHSLCMQHGPLGCSDSMLCNGTIPSYMIALSIAV